MDYQFDLPLFRGPLDLLLYLVKRHEVDLRDIPVAEIVDQFQQYLNVLQVIDVERAGDFLVMASTLAEIKSKMVLSGTATEGDTTEGDDPRRELVRQLLEYKRFKEASERLEVLSDRQGERLARQGSAEQGAAEGKRQALAPVELWDLVSAFGRLLRETLAAGEQQIALDFTPIHVYMAQIVERLEREPGGRLALGLLFTPPYSRGRLVGLFLATLELIKGRRVTAEQPEAFGDIWLTLAEIPKQETGN